MGLEKVGRYAFEERCTTYARSKTLSRRSQEELTSIRKAGLDRLHVGLETGDDALLKKIKNGVTGKMLIELKLLIETLNVNSKVCFDHAGNNWVNRNGQLLFTQSYEGYKFTEEKPRVLELLAEGIEAQ